MILNIVSLTRPRAFGFMVILCVLCCFLPSLPVQAFTKKTEVGLVEHLGDKIPLNLTFRNEEGTMVALGDLIDRPTVIALVYYRCPGICGPLMNGIRQMVEDVEEEVGKDFNILTISFDETENFEDATKKKKNYFAAFQKNVKPQGWRFLTGDLDHINTLTAAIGFQYVENKGEYIHSPVLTFLSPKGLIVRYLVGTSFMKFDVKMALLEADEERVGGTSTRLGKYGSDIALFCFSYDPEGKTYALNILKVVGTVSIFFMLMAVGIVTIYTRKSNKGRKLAAFKEEENT